MYMKYIIGLISVLVLASVAPVEDGPELLFSFGIITDLHMGEGCGEPYNGQDHIAKQATIMAVDGMNDKSVDFVLVLGDLTDSGEVLEYDDAANILSALNVPWLPMLGNHDHYPSGERYFEEKFCSKYVEFPVSVDKAQVPVNNPEINNPELDNKSYFENFAFEYKGYKFICADFVLRGKGGSEADLHSFSGGTLPWFEAQVSSSDKPTFIFSHYTLHHPLDPGWYSLEEHTFSLPGMGYQDFSYGEFKELSNIVKNARVIAWFAGHGHVTKDKYISQAECYCIETDAPKRLLEYEGDIEKSVRVVEVYSNGDIVVLPGELSFVTVLKEDREEILQINEEEYYEKYR